MAENKAMSKELEDIKAKVAASKVTSLFDNAEDCRRRQDHFRLLYRHLRRHSARHVRYHPRQCQEPLLVAVLVGKAEEKLTMAVTVTNGLAQAAEPEGRCAGQGDLAAIAGGKGGGKPDFAMAGLKDETKIDEALAGCGQHRPQDRWADSVQTLRHLPVPAA
ncbi:MAG: DHHA1 domain-containing protein [Faecalibacterium prausnitzii]